MGIVFKAAALALAALAAGCANLNSIHRDNQVSRKNGEIVFTDAKQRGIISNPVTVTTDGKYTFKDGTEVPIKIESQVRLCSEAAPDVFSAYAFSAAAEAAADVAEKTGEGAFSLSSAETAATIARTQTINLFREQMFRTCERFLNGAIDKDELVVQAARDQRIMVSILAVEQLTGVYTSPSTALNTQSGASTGAPTAEMVKLLADAETAAGKAKEAAAQAREEAEKALQEAEEKNNLPAEKKNCREVLADNELGAAEKAKCTTAKEKNEAALEAEKTAKDKKSYYDALKQHAQSLGGTAAFASGAAQFSPSTHNHQCCQQVSTIANAVQNIVAETFFFDELQMTCVVALRRAARGEVHVNNNLLRTCLNMMIALSARDAERAHLIAAEVAIATLAEEASSIEAVLSCGFSNGLPSKNWEQIITLTERGLKMIRSNQLLLRCAIKKQRTPPRLIWQMRMHG